MSEVGSQRRVSLITVLYGGGDVIGACLRSAVAAASVADVELEVILVDNKPGDGTAEVAFESAPGATIISNDENVGFGRACNQGFEVATGTWWLLLNPDATLAEDALAKLIDFGTAHPRAGAVAPILTGAGMDRAESAGMQPSLRSALGTFLFINRLLLGDRGGAWRGTHMRRQLELGPRRVEWASGGALLLRPEAVRETGGFDPSFFLYAEDVDLGQRLTDRGWQTWLVPTAIAEHRIASSSGGVTDRWFVALHDLYRRDAGRGHVVAFDLIAGIGLAVRAAFARRSGTHRRRMAVAARAAMRLAGETIARGTQRD